MGRTIHTQIYPMSKWEGDSLQNRIPLWKFREGGVSQTGHKYLQNGIQVISEEELGKCRYNYKGKDTYAFVMSDRYIMALYTYCLLARKAVVLENIEMEGLSEAELSMVKLESVREVLFQALLLDDVKFEDGKMYAELYSIYIL